MFAGCLCLHLMTRKTAEKRPKTHELFLSFPIEVWALIDAITNFHEKGDVMPFTVELRY